MAYSMLLVVLDDIIASCIPGLRAGLLRHMYICMHTCSIISDITYCILSYTYIHAHTKILVIAEGMETPLPENHGLLLQA